MLVESGSWTVRAGALAALAMLVDPIMTPWMIRYVEREIEVDPNQASFAAPVLPVARSYGSYDSVLNPPIAMDRAWFEGLYSSPETDLMSQLGVSCHTGNCTRPDLETLAICSSCTRRDDEITWHTEEFDNTISFPSTNAMFRNTKLQFLSYLDVTWEDMEIVSSTSPSTGTWRHLLNASILYRDPVLNEEQWLQNDLRQSSPAALECLLSLCAQHIRTKTMDSMTTQIARNLRNDVATIEPPIWSLDDGPLPKSKWHVVQQRPDLRMHPRALKVLHERFLPSGHVGDFMLTPDKAIFRGDECFRSTLHALGKSYERGELPALFDRVALSLTNALRTEANRTASAMNGDASNLVSGTAMTTTRQLEIYWGWFGVIIVGFVLSITFLYLVIKKNERTEQDLRKGLEHTARTADSGGEVRVGGDASELLVPQLTRAEGWQKASQRSRSRHDTNDRHTKND